MMRSLAAIGTIARLTLHEALRRRILLATLIAGAAFVTLYSIGINSAYNNVDPQHNMTIIEKRMMINVLTLAGLTAANLLIVLTSVLLPVDTLSGEIGSGVMQTLAVRPLRRRDIVLGKWLGYWIVIVGYIALVVGGVLLMTAWLAHFTPPRIEAGIPLMVLEASVLLTLSIAGGTRLGTVTNGILAFGLYGMAFIGNWTEQLGTLMGSETSAKVGTIMSLFMPSEAIWQMASFQMQPTFLRDFEPSPFSPVSTGSPVMIGWALGWIVVVLVVALRSFRRRPL